MASDILTSKLNFCRAFNVSCDEVASTVRINLTPFVIPSQGVKPAETLPTTIPQSPAFALKNRIRNIRQQVEESVLQPSTSAPKSKPVPHLGIPFQPKLDHKATESQPFSFETRDRRSLQTKEARIQKVYEGERKVWDFMYLL